MGFWVSWAALQGLSLCRARTGSLGHTRRAAGLCLAPPRDPAVALLRGAVVRQLPRGLRPPGDQAVPAAPPGHCCPPEPHGAMCGVFGVVRAGGATATGWVEAGDAAGPPAEQATAPTPKRHPAQVPRTPALRNRQRPQRSHVLFMKNRQSPNSRLRAATLFLPSVLHGHLPGTDFSLEMAQRLLVFLLTHFVSRHLLVSRPRPSAQRSAWSPAPSSVPRPSHSTGSKQMATGLAPSFETVSRGRTSLWSHRQGTLLPPPVQASLSHPRQIPWAPNMFLLLYSVLDKDEPWESSCFHSLPPTHGTDAKTFSLGVTSSLVPSSAPLLLLP